MEFLKKNTEQFNNNYIKELSNRFDLHENIIRLLFARGFDTADKIDDFLNAGITGLHNPRRSRKSVPNVLPINNPPSVRVRYPFGRENRIKVQKKCKKCTFFCFFI